MPDEPAFPGRRYISREYWTGMTLRDYFAAQVAASMGVHCTPEQIAIHSYQVADAMLERRNQ